MRVNKPDGSWAYPLQNQGSDDGLDSDLDTTTGLTDVITLSFNQDLGNIDAGLFQVEE